MSVKQFTRVSIGAEGIQPGDLRLVTTDVLLAISQPGYLNNIAPLWGINIIQGDLIKILYGPNLDLFIQMVPNFSGTVITLVPSASGGGSVNGATNVGTGEGVFKTQVVDQLQFKSIIAGPNISISPSGADEIEIEATSAGGDITDGQNLGGGEHVFAQKSGSLLQFKTILAGTGIDVTDTPTEITITNTGSGGIDGAANVGGGVEVFRDEVADILNFRSFINGTNTTVVQNANTIQINASGGPGGFDYLDTFWVAKNGNDTNDGKSIDKPKLTIPSAISAFVTPTTPSVIQIVDNGTYTLNHVMVASQNITIIGSASTIASGIPGQAAIEMVGSSTLNIQNVSINHNTSGDAILLTGGGFVNCRNVPRILGDISGGGTVDGTIDTILGDINLTAGSMNLIINELTGAYTGSGSASIRMTANLVTSAWNLSGTASANGNILTTGFGFTINNSGTGIVSGFFGSVNLGNNFLISEASIKGEVYNYRAISANDTVLLTDCNQGIGVYNPSGTIDLTLPDYITEPNIPRGFRCYVWQGYSGGGARFRVLGGDTINSDSNRDFTARGMTEVILTSQLSGPPFDRIWTLAGDVAGSGSSFTRVNVFISAVNGDAATATGDISTPFVTINAAKAYVIATYTANPATGINLVIIDDAIYDESVDFTGTTNINLIGREAQLIYTGAGDAITADATILVAMGVVSATGGGNAITYNSVGLTDAFVGNIDAISQGDVVNNGAAILLLQSYSLLTQHTVTGAGQIVYTALFRASGLDGAGVKGISPDFVQGDFQVNGVLNINAAFSFPSVDGTSGQTLVTDGAGTVTWQAPPFTQMPYTTVAGTSQAAVVNNGYIIGNAGQTTITLPAVAPVGSVVAIKGFGAAGWVMQANVGQLIHLGNVVTSAGGSFTSTNQWDGATAVCIVANTEWSLEAPVSSGLTIA